MDDSDFKRLEVQRVSIDIVLGWRMIFSGRSNEGDIHTGGFKRKLKVFRAIALVDDQ